MAPGYVIVWRPSAFCGRTHLHRIQPRPQVTVIFWYLRPDAPAPPLFRLFTLVHPLTDGSVEGQYVTVWVTASLLKSPGLFFVFLPILMQSLGWSPLVLLFPSPPLLWWLNRVHQLQLVSPSIPCSTVFSVLLQSLSTYLSFCFLSVLLCGQLERQSLLSGSFFFFFYYHSVWSSGRDLVICLYLKTPEKFVRLILQDGFLSLHKPFVCMIKFKFIAQFPVDHLSTQSCLVLYSFVLICCIRLLRNWSFRLYHYIIYTWYFAAFYLFLLVP